MLLILIIASNAILLIFAYRSPSRLRWRLRLLFYPVAMNAIYFLLATAVPRVHPELEDALLQSIDIQLVGTHASLWLEGWIHPIATEFFSFCYLWYLFYLLSSQITYLVGDIGVLKRHYSGLFSIYGIGYACYAALPARGPYLALTDQFSIPLEGGWITRVTSEIVLAASNRVDVFPSLHVAISVYLLMFDHGQNYRRFRLCLVPCAGLVVATLYLRYHYLTDVIFGLALSILALWIARAKLLTSDTVTEGIEAHESQFEVGPHYGSVQRHRSRACEAVCTRRLFVGSRRQRASRVGECSQSLEPRLWSPDENHIEGLAPAWRPDRDLR